MSSSPAHDRVVVTAIEAISPVGATAEKTCAAVNADVSAFSEYPLLACTPNDPEWEESLPLYAATVPTIEPSCTGLERFLRLAIPPLGGLLNTAGLTRKSMAETGLLLALPLRDSATLRLNLSRDLIPALCKRTGLGLKYAAACVEGHVGVFSQLGNAISMLKSGELEQCIVGGVDTYIFKDRLQLLDEQWRLKSGRNVDGFIPGEAGVMIMLEMEIRARARGVKVLGIINGLGSGVEREVLESNKSSTGQGLTTAIKEAWASSAEGIPVQNIYCDFNGESYYAFELGLILSRLATILAENKTLCHPADCYGDIGAASGGLLMACALNDFAKRGASAEAALLWTSSDGGHRLALRLEPAYG